MKAVRIFLLALFTIAALAYLNIIIPQPQQTEARTYNDDKGYLAQEFPCNQGGCVSTANVLKIAVHETPSCTSGTLSSLAGYKGAAWFKNESNDTYKYHVVWGSYFCANATTGSCTNGPILGTTDFTLSPDQTTQTYSPVRSESDLTCGKVQTDMSFQAWRKVGSNWVLALSYGSLSSPGTSNATYTYCNTGKACSTPQTHKTCENNACVVKSGPGSSTCDTDNDCKVQTHKTCENYACVVKSGPGSNTCNTDNDCKPSNPPHLIVKKHVINDDGGTKNAENFTIYVKNANTDVILSQTAGNENGTTITLPSGVLYSVYEGDHTGYDQTFSGDCSGAISDGQTKECTITNNDTHVNPTPTSGCTSNCGSTTINVQQQQQQQQQIVLAATVAPAPTTTQLPSTGANDFAIIPSLLSLVAAGWKLRKLA